MQQRGNLLSEQLPARHAGFILKLSVKFTLTLSTEYVMKTYLVTKIYPTLLHRIEIVRMSVFCESV